MRYHLQGLFVLLIAAIGLLFTLRVAAPVLSDAFGDDGAIVAESAEIEDEGALTSEEAVAAEPLNGDEVGQVQAYLTALGFDPGPIDGILGDGTREAIDLAVVQYQLDTNSSDRAVYDYVRSLAEALAAAAVADTPSSDAGDADAAG